MILHLSSDVLLAVGAVAILATVWEQLAGRGHTTLGVYARLIFVWGWWAAFPLGFSDPLGGALLGAFFLGIPMWRTLRSAVRHRTTTRRPVTT